MTSGSKGRAVAMATGSTKGIRLLRELADELERECQEVARLEERLSATASARDQLNTRLREAETLLRAIAWRTSAPASANWSGPDILTHVADYFGVSEAALAELGEESEEE